MFVTLEKIAQTDPKYADIILLENYAAFQNRYSFIYFLFFFIFYLVCNILIIALGALLS